MSNTLLHADLWPPNMNVNGGVVIDLKSDNIQAFNIQTQAGIMNSDEFLV